MLEEQKNSNAKDSHPTRMAGRLKETSKDRNLRDRKVSP